MIGQVRFAWISFKRSFLASFFSFISQIVTYTAITISIAVYSIVRPYLYRSISQIYYKSYILLGIIFIIVSIIIGGIVTARSIDLKFQSQKDDIAIMKNVGGKNKWIYSYFIFNQILSAIKGTLFKVKLGAARQIPPAKIKEKRLDSAIFLKLIFFIIIN